MSTSNEGLTAQMTGLEKEVLRLKQEATEQASLEERMQNLEQHCQGQGRSMVVEHITAAEGSMGKEKSIDVTYRDDTSPHLLEKFLSHYRLVDRINRESPGME